MKRWILTELFSLAVTGIYFAWRYREEIEAYLRELDADITEHARYRKAVDDTLRSIRKLPETNDKGGE